MSIVIENVQFGYSTEHPVLRDMNLSVDDGEFVLLAGQNGAGKSTLLKLLNGILKPGAGTITVNSLDTRNTPTAILASHIAVTFQNPADQIFASTVREEILFGPRILGRANPDTTTDKCLDLFGLRPHAAKHPYDLPPAHRKLLTIASAVASDAPILAFDEPTASLSQTEQSILLDAFGELRKVRKTLVVVSHDFDFFFPLATRLVVILDGTILFNDHPNAPLHTSSLPTTRGIKLPLTLRIDRILKSDPS